MCVCVCVCKYTCTCTRYYKVTTYVLIIMTGVKHVTFLSLSLSLYKIQLMLCT